MQNTGPNDCTGKEMKFTPYIIELLGKECGREIRIPADCEFLALDIESKTKTHIGSTTLKRLIGFTNDERTPHASTLNTIAGYLGHRSWEKLIDIADKSNSAIDWHSHEVRSSELETGCKVEITYLPDRKITFRYNGENNYTVIESINSKLQEGDILEITNLILDHPMYAKSVRRGTETIGEYTAGIISGISSIKII